MKIARKSLFVVLAAGLILASCAGANQVPESTPDVGASLTAGVGTIVAYFFQTQTAIAPPATVTPSITPLPEPTGSPVTLPTIASIASPTVYYVYISPTPTGTYYTPTTNPASLAYGCNNLTLISSGVDPANSYFKAGSTFTAEWKVANSGTCAWKWSYRVVFISGDSMNGSATHPNQEIAVGKWTTLRVSMEAPSKGGTYTGYWQMSDDAGHTFGPLLSVKIVVAEPTQTPKPATNTPVTPSATPVTPSATPVTPTITNTP